MIVSSEISTSNTDFRLTRYRSFWDVLWNLGQHIVHKSEVCVHAESGTDQVVSTFNNKMEKSTSQSVCHSLYLPTSPVKLDNSFVWILPYSSFGMFGFGILISKWNTGVSSIASWELWTNSYIFPAWAIRTQGQFSWFSIGQILTVTPSVKRERSFWVCHGYQWSRYQNKLGASVGGGGVRDFPNSFLTLEKVRKEGRG